MGNNNSTENSQGSSSEQVAPETRRSLNFSGIYSAKSMSKKTSVATDPTSDENFNGFAKQLHPSGNVYIGEFKNGKRHGKGKVIFTNGTVEEGWFENGTFKGSQYNKLEDHSASVFTDCLKQSSTNKQTPSNSESL